MVVDKKKVFKVTAEYNWRPPRCMHCKVFGHSENSCSRVHKENKQRVWAQKETAVEEFAKVIETGIVSEVIEIVEDAQKQHLEVMEEDVQEQESNGEITTRVMTPPSPHIAENTDQEEGEITNQKESDLEDVVVTSITPMTTSIAGGATIQVANGFRFLDDDEEIPESMKNIMEQVDLVNSRMSAFLDKNKGGSSQQSPIVDRIKQKTGGGRGRQKGASSSKTVSDATDESSLGIRKSQREPITPVRLNLLSTLRELILDSNQLSGTLPTSVGQLSMLEKLSVSNNSLNGVVSEVHFRRLSSLVDLDLGLNSLILNWSSGWIPPFQLYTLNLRSCKLERKIPQWLQTQIQLTYLDMAETSILKVPSWFWNYTSRLSVLDLSSNQIRSPIPILQHNMRVYSQSLYLRSNRFYGPLLKFPSNVVVLDLSNNFISGFIPPNIGYMVPTLQYLLLSNNYVSGSLPASLCKLPNLRAIDVSRNNLSGYVPNCWDSAQNMKVLKLSSNNLIGLIPSSLGKLSNLMSLHLSNNKFLGEIPSALKTCRALKILNLGENGFSGNIPSWLGDLLRLTILRLKSNRFNGSLSTQLCQLDSLQIIDLSENHLSGLLPTCFNNFTGMKLEGSMLTFRANGYDETLDQVIKGIELEYTNVLQYLVNFDLSSNDFVGQIPEELVSLDGLKSLNLSYNQLTGEIPRKIGNLKRLESLDFSYNLLSGLIPLSLSNLGFLGHMNLSFNNLSGQIPLGSQTQTFGSSAFIGNSQLCGLPLEKICSQDTPSNGVDDKRMNQGEMFSEEATFYISMGVGTIVGFWGVWGLLLLKKAWRYTYFQFLDRMRDQLLLTSDILVARIKKQLQGNQVA